MAETLTRNESSIQPQEEMDLESIRSRITEISIQREGGFESVDSSVSDPPKFLEDCGSKYQAITKKLVSPEWNLLALDNDGLDLYLDSLKKEISLVLEENVKFNGEIESLMDIITREKCKVDGGLQECEYSIRCANSHNLVSEKLRDIYGSHESRFEDHKYEMYKLDNQMKEDEMRSKDMQDLESALKSFEMLEQDESTLSEVRVLEFKDNCLRLFLKGPIATSNGIISGQKLKIVTEPIISDHELMIEFNEETTEIKKVEIFPSDVAINEILGTIKSSRDVSNTPLLARLVSLVKYHVGLKR